MYSMQFMGIFGYSDGSAPMNDIVTLFLIFWNISSDGLVLCLFPFQKECVAD